MTRNPFRLGLLSAALFCAPLRAEDPGLRELLRDALYTEEVTRDAEKAATQYEEILSRHDEQRAFAASALFRLAEVRRKQERKEDAIALYQQLLTRFPEAKAEAKLAQENLVAMGSAPPANGPLAEPDRDEADLKRLQALAESSPDQLRDPQAFNIAIQEGRTKIVEYLLSKGADPATPGAMAIAAERGNLGLCKLLLQHGKPSQEEAGKALAGAIRNDRLVILTHLLEQGLDPNSPVDTQFGIFESPLTVAVASGKLKAASLLLDHKADVNFMMQSKDRPNFNASFGTPLHVAVISEQAGLPMIRLLLERGADPNMAAPGTELTPLHFAASQSGPDSDVIVSELLAKGADPNRRSLVTPPGQNTIDPERELFAWATPFEVALKSDAAAKIEAMLSKGASLNLHDQEGRTLLSAALRNENSNRIEWLLRSKVDPDVADKDGTTPLALAAHSGDSEQARMLLEAGADPNKPSRGLTPISIATKNQLGWPLVELLMEKGAKPDAEIFKRAMNLSKWDVAVKMLGAGAPLPDAAESYPWDAPLVRALQSPTGWPAFEKMIAMGAKLDEAWIKSGFQDSYFNYTGQHSPVPSSRLPYLFRTFMLPRLESTGAIRLVIHDERGTNVSVLEESGKLSSRRMPLAQLLLAPKEEPRWSTRILPTDRMNLWRKTGGEWKAVHEFAIGGDDAFPAVEPGDVIELTDDPDADNRPSGRPSMAPELKWSLRKRVSFPVTVEIDGKKQDVKLRGDLLVFDPTTRDLPLTGARGVIGLLWQPEIDLQELLWGRDSNSIKADVVIHRDGWPEVRIPYASTGEDFPLQAGDRISLAMPGLTHQLGLRDRRVTLKGDNFPFARYFGEWTASQGLLVGSVPTLMQALAEVMQSPLRDAPDKAEALPAYLMAKHGPAMAFIQRPDFSRIRIRRLQEDGSEKVIEVDLAALIAASNLDDTPEKIRASDLELQAGDIVELPALPPREGEPWTGLTAKEQSYFAKALDCRVQVSDSNGRLTLQEIRFQAPRMIATAGGLVPLPPATGVASLAAFTALKPPTGLGITLSRGVHPVSSFDPHALFLREGDRLVMPPVPAPPPPGAQPIPQPRSVR